MRALVFDDYIRIATVCATSASLLSVIHIFRHCCCNKGSVALKHCVLRILMMIPIYAVNAQSSLRHSRGDYAIPELFGLVREWYEAVTVVAFVQLLLIWMGGATKVAQAFAAKMQEPQHPWIAILPCLKGTCVDKLIPMPYNPGYGLVAGVIIGIMQFSLVIVISCFASSVIWSYAAIRYLTEDWTAEAHHHFLEIALKVPQAFKTVSVCWAMYNLLLFFLEVMRNELLKHSFEEIKPEGKFICIKAVIGFTAIQKVLCETVFPKLHIFEKYVGKEHGNNWTPEQAAFAVQNFLLCVELLFFAVWHFFAYPTSQFDGHASRSDFHNPLNAGVCGMFRDVKKLHRLARDQTKYVNQLHSAHKLSDSTLQEMFKFFDVDGSGTISSQEFRFLLKSTNHSEEVIDDILQHADPNKDGNVTKSEFVTGLLARSAPKEKGLSEPLLP